MRFRELSSFKPFKVTVRLQHEKSTITTICFCDSASNMRKMLAELFGKNNVLSVSEIVSESPQTDQIQREAAIRPKAIQRRAQPPKVAQNANPRVQQRQHKRQVSTRPIAAPLKHRVVQNKLTKQFMRQSNIVKPTTDDIQIAKNRAETALKKADLDYKKQAEEQLRRQERERRRRRHMKVSRAQL